MVRSTSIFATLFTLLSTGTMSLAPAKLGARSRPAPPMRSIGVTSRFTTPKRSTRLTSTYVEARHVHKRKMSWLPSFLRMPTPLKRRASELRQRKGSKRVLAIILAIIIVFAPSFSPAHATTAATASTARGVSPVMPFSSRSRALGTFNLLPTKAELELCFRLLYAACLGSFVGLERSSSDRPAGVRTMALVGLGACIYAICSAHGFLPHLALGYAPGSPLLDNVKVDLSRMAANIASGVGFIGAGAIHKSKLHGNGTEAQNVVAGLTTAAAIWVSAAVGIASAVGLYFVGAAATFSTVGILRYARLSKDEEPGFSWRPRPLDSVDAQDARQETTPQRFPPVVKQDVISGLFGKQAASGYDGHDGAFLDHVFANPHFERYLQSRLAKDNGIPDEQNLLLQNESKVLIEEEQQVILNKNITDHVMEP